MDFYYKRDILRKYPEIAKQMVQSLKNTNLQIFSLDFFNVDNLEWHLCNINCINGLIENLKKLDGLS